MLVSQKFGKMSNVVTLAIDFDLLMAIYFKSVIYFVQLDVISISVVCSVVGSLCICWFLCWFRIHLCSYCAFSKLVPTELLRLLWLLVNELKAYFDLRYSLSICSQIRTSSSSRFWRFSCCSWSHLLLASDVLHLAWRLASAWTLDIIFKCWGKTDRLFRWRTTLHVWSKWK